MERNQSLLNNLGAPSPSSGFEARHASSSDDDLPDSSWDRRSTKRILCGAFVAVIAVVFIVAGVAMLGLATSAKTSSMGSSTVYSGTSTLYSATEAISPTLSPTPVPAAFLPKVHAESQALASVLGRQQRPALQPHSTQAPVTVSVSKAPQYPSRLYNTVAIMATPPPATIWNSEPTTTVVPPAKMCLVHVSFGSSYDVVNGITVPTKRRYADMHGYELKIFQAPSFAELLEGHFSGCLGHQITAESGFDKQTVLKWCGIWRSFEDGCSVAMWTDADAVIHAPQLTIQYWMSRNPRAEVYWSLDDPGANKWCAGAQDGLDRFASCVNGGVFIMRNTPWTKAFLQRTVLLGRETLKDHCGTASLNSVWFDQCMFTHFNLAQYDQEHVGDQCVVSCDAMHEEGVLAHYQTFGPNDSPRFQYVILASFYFPRELFFWREPPITADTFVINCGGHLTHDQLLDCVKYAAYL